MSHDNGHHLGAMARGAGAVFVGILVARVARYGFSLVVARMGTETWGSISIGLATLEILSTVACLGMLTAVVRNVAMHAAGGDPGRIRGTILSAWGMATGVGLLASVMLWLLAGWLALTVFEDPQLEPVLRAIAILVPINVGYQVLAKSLLGGQAVTHYVAIWRIGDNTLKFVVLLGLYLLDWRLEGVLLAYGVTITAGLVLSALVVNRKVSPLIGAKAAPPVFEVVKLLALSLPLMLTGFLTMFAGWVDTLTLGYFCPPATVGIYAAVLLISSAITLGPDLIYPVILPLLTERYAKGKTEELTAAFATATRWILWTAIPTAAFVLAFAGPLLTELFGADYTQGRDAVVILVAGRLLFVISWTRATVLVIAERTRVILYMAMVASCANAAFNLLLIPHFGIVGAALATGASLALHALLTFAVVQRTPNLASFSGARLPGIGRVVLAAAVAVASGKAILALIGTGLEDIVMCAVAFGVVYGAVLTLMRAFVSEDLYVMRMALQKVGLPAPSWLHVRAETGGLR